MAEVPAGYAQFTAVHAGDALPWGAVTTWGLQTGSGVNGQAMCDALTLAYGDVVQETAVTGVTLVRGELKLGPSATGPTFISGSGQVGDQGSTGVPPNVSILVRKNVENFSGRLAGRVFLPGLNETIVSSAGFIDLVQLPAFQTTLENWRLAIGVENAAPVVFSSVGASPRPVTEFSVDSRVATQRRRLRR